MKNAFSLFTVLATVGALSGCAGKVEYTQPAALSKIDTSVTIKEPKDVVWKRIVRNLSKEFYVINNIDNESGLINVSYSSNPEAVIDCGRVKSYVKNARGERTYEFAGASQSEEYEIMDMEHGNGLFAVNRRISVEGRANIVVQSETPSQTDISVSVKYVVTKALTLRSPTSPIPVNLNDTVSFNSGSSGIFQGAGETICRSTGKFESDILAASKT